MSIEEIVVKGTKPKTGDEYYSRAMMGGTNIYAGGREPSKYQIVERGVAPPIENNLDFLDEVEVDVESINPGNVRYQGQMFDELGNLVVDVGKGLYDTAATTSKAISNIPVVGNIYRSNVGGGLTGRMAANMIPPLKTVYNDFGFAEGGPVNASMYDTIDISETIIDENEKDFQKRKMIERLREKFDPEGNMSDDEILLEFRKTLEEPGFPALRRPEPKDRLRGSPRPMPYPPISPFEEPDPDEDYGSNWYDSLTDEEKARIDKQNKPYRDRNRMLKPEIYDGPTEQLAHGGQVRRRVPDIYFNKYNMGGAVNNPSTMGIQSLTPSLTTHSVPGSPQTNAVNTNDPRFSNNSVNPITALASGIGNLNKSTNTTNALLKKNSTNPNANANANLKINYTPNPTTKENRFAFFNALDSTRPSLG